MRLKKTKIGLIGRGKISAQYIECCQQFHHLEITACADISLDTAREKAHAPTSPHVKITFPSHD